MWSAQRTTWVSLPARPVEFMANPADVSRRLFGSTLAGHAAIVATSSWFTVIGSPNHGVIGGAMRAQSCF